MHCDVYLDHARSACVLAHAHCGLTLRDARDGGAGGDLYEELKRVGGRFRERDTAARVLAPALQVT